MSISIHYGVNNSVEKPAEDYVDVSEILEDENLRQFLGFGDNVEARVNGIASDLFEDGARIDIVSRANTKG